jgi:hypothetical protein
MPKAFDELSETDASGLIQPPADFDEVYDFVYTGDHWRAGGGFVGPTTASERSEAESAAVRTGWSRRFVSENVLGETAKRARDVVAGKEPHWSAELARPLSEAEEEDADKLPAEDRAALEEADGAMAEWWDGRHGITLEAGERRKVTVHGAVKAFALGIKAFGRAGLRIRIPHGRLQEEERTVIENGVERRTVARVLAVDTPREALRHIFAECILPDIGRLYTAPDTMYDLGVISYSDTDEIDTSKQVRYAELTYLDYATEGVPPFGQDRGEPLTVLRILQSSGEARGGTAKPAEQAFDEWRFDLGGRLLYHEGLHERTATTQMLELQKALNTEATELAIVLDQEGFPEVILMNTLGPGTWVKDETTGREKFVAAPYSRGPGKRSFFMGEPVMDETGAARGYTSPSVHQLQAADVEGYLKAMDARRRAMLRQSRQSWVEITDDAAASGESRVQALMDFLEEARDFKAVIDGALKWLLETVWALACDLAGDPAASRQTRFVADCKITVPFIPAALRDAILKERMEGLRSDETAMTDLGIEDVEAEKARIAESDRQKMTARKTQAEIVGALGRILSNRRALEFAGVDPAEAQQLSRTDDVPTGGDGQ